MKTYTEFHGDVPIKEIGKRLRDIVKIEKNSFKIMTGYGSSSGLCASKQAAIKSLSKMKKEGIIKDFLPGEFKGKTLTPESPFYKTKLEFSNQIKNDSDYGNDGIIFIFK